jgi:hypothetical protein
MILVYADGEFHPEEPEPEPVAAEPRLDDHMPKGYEWEIRDNRERVEALRRRIYHNGPNSFGDLLETPSFVMMVVAGGAVGVATVLFHGGGLSVPEAAVLVVVCFIVMCAASCLADRGD